MEKRKDNKGRNLKAGEIQKADGRYRYRYMDANGKQRDIYSWKLVKTDKPPAGKRDCIALRELEKAIEKDNADGIDGRSARRLTVNMMFDKFMESKSELKQSTRHNYTYMYDHFIRETFGNKRIDTVKYSDILTLYNHLVNDCGFALNTLEIINNTLHPLFEMAVRDDLIRKNPTTGVLNEVKKSHKWERPQRHALTIAEQNAFIEFTADHSVYSHWMPLFTFLFGTGCRIGETIGLTWQDVDFKENTISINHNMTYRPQADGRCEYHITTPKTAAGVRTIPMLTDVRKALLNERERQLINGGCTSEIDGYTGFVFINRYNEALNPASVNRAIERITRDYNEQETDLAEREHREAQLIRHFTAHNIRHTFATRFCENETNVKVIQSILGHADISTTMNIYAEATADAKKETIDSLDGKIKLA